MNKRSFNVLRKMAAEDTVPFDSPISKLTGQDGTGGALRSAPSNRDRWAYYGFDSKQAKRDSNAKIKSILGLSPFDILNKRRTRGIAAKSLPAPTIVLPPTAAELAEERHIRDLLAAAEAAPTAPEADIIPHSSADEGAIPVDVLAALEPKLYTSFLGDKYPDTDFAKAELRRIIEDESTTTEDLLSEEGEQIIPGAGVQRYFNAPQSENAPEDASPEAAPETTPEATPKDTGNPYLSYGGLGALGALTGALVDKKNRLRGGGVGLLSALLANYAYRKLRYGSDVTL